MNTFLQVSSFKEKLIEIPNDCHQNLLLFNVIHTHGSGHTNAKKMKHVNEFFSISHKSLLFCLEGLVS